MRGTRAVPGASNGESIMAGAVSDHAEHDEWVAPSGEDLARRLFAVVMLGVCAVIVLMVSMGGWGGAA